MLFAGYILKNCASVLEATNFSKTGKVCLFLVNRVFSIVVLLLLGGF